MKPPGVPRWKKKNPALPRAKRAGRSVLNTLPL
jgi:hypothetical protein